MKDGKINSWLVLMLVESFHKKLIKRKILRDKRIIFMGRNYMEIRMGCMEKFITNKQEAELVIH